MTSGAAQRERLATVIGPAVATVGCDLEEVTVSPAGKRKVVRVVVDADAGVSLDRVAAVARAVTEVLDAKDTELFGASPYVLEVTSPGVDRPLTEPRHWRRAVGRLVEVPVAGTPTRGRVVAADEAGIELATDAGSARHAWAELGRGKVQVEFARAGEDEADDDETDADDEADDELADDDDDIQDDDVVEEDP